MGKSLKTKIELFLEIILLWFIWKKVTEKIFMK